MVQHTLSPTTENEAFDPADGTWLTARAVMDETGISKDDLVRFIQLNVLPKSMMRVLATTGDPTRKKSYFSSTLLGHVAMLKMLRDEGHSVESIARELGPPATHDHRPSGRQPSPPNAGDAANGQKANPLPPACFPLAAGAITGSAFLVNPDMHIGWIQVAPDDGLLGAIRDEMADDPSGTVFDILLRASLKALVFNWQPLFSFVYRFLEETTAPETFKRAAPLVSFHLDELQGPATRIDRHKNGRPMIDSSPIRFEDAKGRKRAMRLYALSLSDGVLFVFQEERWPAADAQTRPGTDVSGMPQPCESTDLKIPFSVISARIDDAQQLVDTLLPETYYRLITRIWDETDRIVESYDGQRSNRSGTEVQYIIPRHAGTDPAFDAIRCAIELRESVRKTKAALKSEGQWVADIRLDIGISSGRDYLPEDDPTASVAFMLPGGAADQASHLSAIAQDGDILITKSAFGHLSARQMERITFGIRRENRLVPNIFARVADLLRAPDPQPMGQEIRTLFVTSIVDLKSDRAG